MKTVAKTGVLFLAMVLLLASGVSQGWAEINDGLVAFYPFDGNANDASGNGNNGKIKGATLTSDRFGGTNGAYAFDGVNDFIRVKNSAFFDFTAAVTFSAWVNPSAMSARESSLIEKWKKGKEEKLLLFRPDAKIGFYLSNCFNLQEMTSADPIELNQWTFVVATYDGSKANIYLNGDLDASEAVSQNCILNSTGKMYIGFNPDRAYTKEHAAFRGTIDDVRIYNRALSPSEIQQLYIGPPRYELSDDQKALIAANGNPDYLTIAFNSAKQRREETWTYMKMKKMYVFWDGVSLGSSDATVDPALYSKPPAVDPSLFTKDLQPSDLLQEFGNNYTTADISSIDPSLASINFKTYYFKDKGILASFYDDKLVVVQTIDIGADKVIKGTNYSFGSEATPNNFDKRVFLSQASGQLSPLALIVVAFVAGVAQVRPELADVMVGGQIFHDCVSGEDSKCRDEIHMAASALKKQKFQKYVVAGFLMMGMSTDMLSNAQDVCDNNTAAAHYRGVPLFAAAPSFTCPEECTSWTCNANAWSVCDSATYKQTCTDPVGAPQGCVGDPSTPLTQTCIPQCTSWTCNTWSACDPVTDTQTCTDSVGSPDGCTGEPPAPLTQACTPVPAYALSQEQKDLITANGNPDYITILFNSDAQRREETWTYMKTKKVYVFWDGVSLGSTDVTIGPDAYSNPPALDPSVFTKDTKLSDLVQLFGSNYAAVDQSLLSEITGLIDTNAYYFSSKGLLVDFLENKAVSIQTLDVGVAGAGIYQAVTKASTPSAGYCAADSSACILPSACDPNTGKKTCLSGPYEGCEWACGKLAGLKFVLAPISSSVATYCLHYLTIADTVELPEYKEARKECAPIGSNIFPADEGAMCLLSLSMLADACAAKAAEEMPNGMASALKGADNLCKANGKCNNNSAISTTAPGAAVFSLDSLSSGPLLTVSAVGTFPICPFAPQCTHWKCNDSDWSECDPGTNKQTCNNPVGDEPEGCVGEPPQPLTKDCSETTYKGHFDGTGKGENNVCLWDESVSGDMTVTIRDKDGSYDATVVITMSIVEPQGTPKKGVNCPAQFNFGTEPLTISTSFSGNRPDFTWNYNDMWRFDNGYIGNDSIKGDLSANFQTCFLICTDVSFFPMYVVLTKQ